MVFAIVRSNMYDPTKLAEVRAQLPEFQELHASQPGYRGTVVVDVGDGRWLTLNLWESEAHATAALPAMAPHVQRLFEPLTAGQSEVVGAGSVVLTDLTTG